MTTRATKRCPACGRDFAWRKRWADNWDNVRWCSAACRRAQKSQATKAQAEQLEHALLALLADRAAGASICPSEVARQQDADAWRPLMEPVRRAARRLADRGLVQWLQGGKPVDPAYAKGPVRLRLAPCAADKIPDG